MVPSVPVEAAAVVKGTTVVSAGLSNVAAVMGVREERTSYPATPLSDAGTFHMTEKDVLRRSATADVMADGAPGPSRSTAWTAEAVPVPKLPTGPAVAVMVTAAPTGTDASVNVA